MHFLKNIKVASVVICIITLLLSQTSYISITNTLEIIVSKEVYIDIHVEEPVYLLVPTNIAINVTDSDGKPISGLSGKVYINDTLVTEFITSENGEFSFV